MSQPSYRLAASALVLAAFTGAGCSGDVTRFAYMGEQSPGGGFTAPVPVADGYTPAPQGFGAPSYAPQTVASAPLAAPAPAQVTSNGRTLLPPPPDAPLPSAPTQLAAPAPAPVTAPEPPVRVAAVAPQPVVAQPEPEPVEVRPATPPAQTVETPAPVTSPAPAPAPSPAEQQAAVAPQTAAPRGDVASQSASADTSSKFRWPVRGRVISQFGTKPDGQRNDGINLVVPEGTPVKAAKDGEVIYAGSELEGYGKLVLVRHANNWVTAYAHNSSLQVNRGDTVRRGEVIAKAGRTGNVTFPQVHFEIRQGSTPVNPMKHLEG